MGDGVLHDELEDSLGLDRAQADVRARHRGHRPREAPAVAMEHRQRPQVNRVRRHRPRHHVAAGFQESAAMVVDDPLRPPRRARGVVERNRVGLRLRQRPLEIGFPGLQEFFVFHLAEALAGAAVLRVVDIHDDWLFLQFR
jgi:hypothetical protein